MSQAESNLSRNIIKELRRYGWWAVKFHASEHTESGVPDILCCAHGYFIGLETKMPAKRTNVSERQKRQHAKIEASGGSVFVVCSPREAVAAVRRVLDAAGS